MTPGSSRRGRRLGLEPVFLVSCGKSPKKQNFFFIKTHGRKHTFVTWCFFLFFKLNYFFGLGDGI